MDDDSASARGVGMVGDVALPVRHRPWSTLLLVVHWFAVIGGGLLIGLAVVAFVAQATAPPLEPGESGEAWGIAIGMIAGTVGLLVFLPSLTLLVTTTRGRRAADQGRAGTLRTAAVATVVLGGLAMVASALSSGSTRHIEDAVVPLVLAALYTAPAIGVLAAARER